MALIVLDFIATFLIGIIALFVALHIPSIVLGGGISVILFLIGFLLYVLPLSPIGMVIHHLGFGFI